MEDMEVKVTMQFLTGNDSKTILAIPHTFSYALYFLYLFVLFRVAESWSLSKHATLNRSVVGQG